MDRERQLANVAFGGAWSEEIAGREALGAALACIEAAARRAGTADLRRSAPVRAALQQATAQHPKGAMLAAAWEKALMIDEPGVRVAELTRIAATLRTGLGARGLGTQGSGARGKLAQYQPERPPAGEGVRLK